MILSPKKQYSNCIGDIAFAVNLFCRIGGQFYKGKHKDSPNTIVCGNKIITIWPKQVGISDKVRELIDFFAIEDVDPLNLTVGRIARWFVSDILLLPFMGSLWSAGTMRLARKGEHWHYTYVKTGHFPFAVEIDLTSAYATQWVNNPSLLYDPLRYTYYDDGGAKDRLKEMLPLLPKWFRLRILGILASYHRQFYILDKKNNNQLKLKSTTAVMNGFAFNCTHKVVLDVYNHLKALHLLAGSDCIRCHTDSITIACDGFNSSESGDKIIKYLEDNKFNFKIKGIGRTYFMDLNTGFIGDKIIGSLEEVRSRTNLADVTIPDKEDYSAFLQTFFSKADNVL